MSSFFILQAPFSIKGFLLLLFFFSVFQIRPLPLFPNKHQVNRERHGKGEVQKVLKCALLLLLLYLDQAVNHNKRWLSPVKTSPLTKTGNLLPWQQHVQHMARKWSCHWLQRVTEPPVLYRRLWSTEWPQQATCPFWRPEPRHHTSSVLSLKLFPLYPRLRRLQTQDHCEDDIVEYSYGLI